MSKESLNWIKTVSTVSPNSDEDIEEILEILSKLLEDPVVNKTAEYALAQRKANEYLNNGEKIPDGLVQAIKALAHQDSGYTGLTIHEAYVGFIRNGELNKIISHKNED